MTEKVMIGKHKQNFPLALEPPKGSIVVLNSEMVEKAVEASRKSPRRRIILPFHKSHDENLHRMLNVMQPGSYARPHRHLDPPKAESIVMLKGAIAYVSFNSNGDVDQIISLKAGSEAFGIDTMPGVFHTILALEPDTVLFEVKPGPYTSTSDKDFAVWAPHEYTPEADAYLKKLLTMMNS